MNLQNIISAGRMMSVVVALLGAFRCGVEFATGLGTSGWGVALGVVVVVCGLALVVAIPLAERRAGFAAVVSGVGTLPFLLGVAALLLDRVDPFSWMLAIVGVAIFIDTLCLYIKLRPGR